MYHFFRTTHEKMIWPEPIGDPSADYAVPDTGRFLRYMNALVVRWQLHRMISIAVNLGLPTA
jgi:hypothetical protein